MAWFKVDDGFYTSHKVLQINRNIRNEAVGSWLLVATWSADKMTDGVVPKYILDDFNVSEEVCIWLFKTGLWDDENENIVFHDWHEYQPMKAELTSKRAEISAKRSAAGKAGMASRYQTANKALTNSNPEPEPEPVKVHSYSEAVRGSEYSDEFEIFWSAYPRKQAKGDAWKAWKASAKTRPEIRVLIDACRTYEKTITDPQFLKMPGPWIRARRWEDSAPSVAKVATVRRSETWEQKDARVEAEQQAREIARLKRKRLNNE